MKTKSVSLYHAEWCGHCRDFKPEWNKFKSVYEASKDDIASRYGLTLEINDYESGKHDAEITQAGVRGFPTIRIVSNGKSDEYTGDRTAKALFRKVIPEVSDDDLERWLKAGAPGTGTGTATTATQGRGPSYPKYLKYKRKYESLEKM